MPLRALPPQGSASSQFRHPGTNLLYINTKTDKKQYLYLPIASHDHFEFLAGHFNLRQILPEFAPVSKGWERFLRRNDGFFNKKTAVPRRTIKSIFNITKKIK